MNRLIVVIVVVLLGLASVSGPTMAANIAGGNFWTVATSESCLEPEAAVEKAPIFRPCSKKIHGHAVACQQMTAILPLFVASMFTRSSAGFIQQDTETTPILADDGHFRPPQAG